MTKRITSEETNEVIQGKAIQNKPGNGAYNTGKWSEEEHNKFLVAIDLHGNQWKKVRDHVKTRNCAQIRSHCQKYFRRKKNMKIQELRRTNRIKGMVFLVTKEYYNYAASANKHGEALPISEPKSIKIEKESKAVSEPELPKIQELFPIPELVIYDEHIPQDSIDISFLLEDKPDILAEDEILGSEVNLCGGELQLSGTNFDYLYESELPLHDHFIN